MAQQTDHIGDTNKMVTAVEWLYEKIQDKMYIQYGYSDGVRKIVIPIEKVFEFIAKAKQMEKEQIINALDLGRRDIDYPMNGEQYYNEIFNK
jgi:peptidyl-tRNA hydrolase